MRCSRSQFVAATTRTSTRTVSELPSRWNSRSCRTRRSLACSSSGRSPISSSKQGAALRLLKAADPALYRAGKRAADVAEQLGFQQIFG